MITPCEIQTNSGVIVNLIAAVLFYSWEDKQGHNYSPNKQVEVMYRIKECAADPWGREKHIVAFCLRGFKTEQLLTPPNRASLQENLIMTRNDKFTLCNYLLLYLVGRGFSVCLVGHKPGEVVHEAGRWYTFYWQHCRQMKCCTRDISAVLVSSVESTL